jgi:hypothetical protein
VSTRPASTTFRRAPTVAGARSGAPIARGWVEAQARRRGELRLRTQLAAVHAHRACLVVGVAMVAVGLANACTLLPHGPLAAFAYLCSGLGLLRWVAGGRGSPTALAR